MGWERRRRVAGCAIDVFRPGLVGLCCLHSRALVKQDPRFASLLRDSLDPLVTYILSSTQGQRQHPEGTRLAPGSFDTETQEPTRSAGCSRADYTDDGPPGWDGPRQGHRPPGSLPPAQTGTLTTTRFRAAA